MTSRRVHLMVALNLCWPAFALFGYGSAQRPADDKPTLSGRVLEAGTSQPIPGATVKLTLVGRGSPVIQVLCDSVGRFEFLGLAVGRYQVAAASDGFVPLQYGQRTGSELGKVLDLPLGYKAHADIVLPRTSSLSGLIVGEADEPAGGVSVQLMEMQFVAGRERLVPIKGIPESRSDDRGRFSVGGLPPGAYYVVGVVSPFAGSQGVGFQTTFYPGVADASMAQPIRLEPGQSLAAVRLRLLTASSYKVLGAVTDAEGRAIKATVMLKPTDQQELSPLLVARTTTDPKGRFVYNDVVPGTYSIQAFGPSPTGALGKSAFGAVSITVQDRDLADIDITAVRNTARGRIVFRPGAALPKDRSDVLLVGIPTDLDSAPIVGGGGPTQVVNSDWTFEISNLSGLRVIRVSSAAGKWRLERTVLQGLDLTDQALDFRKGDVNGLEITVTDQTSELTGSVTDLTGRPWSDYSVIVFSLDKTKWKYPSRFVAIGRPNQDGRFTIEGLPSGQYGAVAVSFVGSTEYQDPAFLDKLVPHATPVQISQGERSVADLKLTVLPGR